MILAHSSYFKIYTCKKMILNLLAALQNFQEVF